MITSDPEEIKDLIEKGTISDIGEFIKQAARESDLVADPEKFEENWNRHASARALEQYKHNAPESIGSKHAELARSMKEHGIDLQAEYDKLTPKQKFVGKLTAKLSFASTIKDIADIFTWAEIEMGPMGWKERCLALFHSAQLIGTDAASYRGIRKIFLLLTEGNDIAILPEYLKADNAREAIQKAACAKLLKAKSNEDVENVFTWAGVELGQSIGNIDRYVVFYQIVEMLEIGKEQYQSILPTYCLMSKD